MEMHDFDEAYRQAHSLKGVAGNLSFTKLYNIAAEIASNLREGEYVAAESYLPDAEAAHERIVEALESSKPALSSTAPARKAHAHAQPHAAPRSSETRRAAAPLRAHIPRNHAKEREPAAAPMRSAQQDTRSSRACTRPKCARATKNRRVVTRVNAIVVDGERAQHARIAQGRLSRGVVIAERICERLGRPEDRLRLLQVVENLLLRHRVDAATAPDVRPAWCMAYECD